MQIIDARKPGEIHKQFLFTGDPKLTGNFERIALSIRRCSVRRPKTFEIAMTKR